MHVEGVQQLCQLREFDTIPRFCAELPKPYCATLRQNARRASKFSQSLSVHACCKQMNMAKFLLKKGGGGVL